MDYTACSEAPEVYHFWVGLTIISAALRRAVFKDRGRYILYPNIYTFLVGPPGTGKSSAICLGTDLLRQTVDPPPILDTFYTAPSLITELAGISLAYQPPKTPVFVVGDEAPTFFRRAKYAEDLIPLLIKLYDCRSDGIGGSTQARGLEKVKEPYGVGIWGVIPDILVELMPKELVMGGFASRVIWVYSEDYSRCFPHPELLANAMPQDLERRLVHDLNEIANLSGEMQLAPKTYKKYEEWYRDIRGNLGDALTIRQMGYLRRKPITVYKLMMLFSIAESDNMIIEPRHFDAAVASFEKLEPDLPKIYRSVGRSADKLSIADKVLWKINDEGGEINRTKLTRWCSNNQITVDELDNALHQLASEGKVDGEKRGRVLYYKATGK